MKFTANKHYAMEIVQKPNGVGIRLPDLAKRSFASEKLARVEHFVASEGDKGDYRKKRKEWLRDLMAVKKSNRTE